MPEENGMKERVEYLEAMVASHRTQIKALRTMVFIFSLCLAFYALVGFVSDYIGLVLK